MNRNALAMIDILVTQPECQSQIADQLLAFDTLITNHKRQIELLEEAARLIYTEWFIHLPGDPNREEYRQSNTMGPAFRHWRRAKIGRRFRLFFRFDSTTRIIIFAWVNDEKSLRSSGSKSDPYAVFQKTLQQGHPPNDWPRSYRPARQSGSSTAYSPSS